MEKNSENHVSLTKKGKEFYIFFLRFLKENKAFYPYQKALLKNRGIPFFKELCNNNDLRIIDVSFTWSYTIQGHSFWSCLDAKFMDEWLSYKKKKAEILMNKRLSHSKNKCNR